MTGFEESTGECALSNSRELALDLLLRVKRSDSYINLLLPHVLRAKKLSDPDRGMVQELSYGALRWQLQYDEIINLFTPGKVLSDEVRATLQLGMHQLFRMRVPEHAAINETVELVKKVEPRASGLANAVLRKAQRQGLEALVAELVAGKPIHAALAIRYSHPEWVVLALAEALKLDGRDDNLEALLAANNETPVINLAALSSAAYDSLLAAGLEPGFASPISLEFRGNPETLLGGDIRVQDQGSQLVALALAELMPEGADVLDMCSGPGGKSAVLQSRISSGSLTCMEPNPARAKLVEEALGENSVARVVTAPGQEAKPKSFDAVLLDAPCSGLGSLRRKPESRWRKAPNQLAGLLKTQRELIDAAIQALRPGGVLLYSTCSPVVVETNGQISEALVRHPEVELVDLVPVMLRINPELQLNTSRRTVQLWTDRDQTDAMFLAALRKK